LTSNSGASPGSITEVLGLDVHALA
jgi:hypothetical protein